MGLLSFLRIGGSTIAKMSDAKKRLESESMHLETIRNGKQQITDSFRKDYENCKDSDEKEKFRLRLVEVEDEVLGLDIQIENLSQRIVKLQKQIEDEEKKKK